MFRRRNQEKIILFADIPTGLNLNSENSAKENVYFFGRKGRFFSGVFKLAESLKLSYSVVHGKHYPFSQGLIYCTEKKLFLDKNNLVGDIENSILNSPIDWKYLDMIEFYYQ